MFSFDFSKFSINNYLDIVYSFFVKTLDLFWEYVPQNSFLAYFVLAILFCLFVCLSYIQLVSMYIKFCNIYLFINDIFVNKFDKTINYLFIFSFLGILICSIFVYSRFVIIILNNFYPIIVFHDLDNLVKINPLFIIYILGINLILSISILFIDKYNTGKLNIFKLFSVLFLFLSWSFALCLLYDYDLTLLFLFLIFICDCSFISFTYLCISLKYFFIHFNIIELISKIKLPGRFRLFSLVGLRLSAGGGLGVDSGGTGGGTGGGNNSEIPPLSKNHEFIRSMNNLFKNLLDNTNVSTEKIDKQICRYLYYKKPMFFTHIIHKYTLTELYDSQLDSCIPSMYSRIKQFDTRLHEESYRLFENVSDFYDFCGVVVKDWETFNSLKNPNLENDKSLFFLKNKSYYYKNNPDDLDFRKSIINRIIQENNKILTELESKLKKS